MKNTIQDLRDHLMAAIELVGDETITGESLQDALDRGKIIASLSSAYTNTVKVELQYMMHVSKGGNYLGSDVMPKPLELD